MPVTALIVSKTLHLHCIEDTQVTRRPIAVLFADHEVFGIADTHPPNASKTLRNVSHPLP
jgi:hypothetical protein